ncbi:MAG TPA: hypothetical protein VKS01_08670, partial [Bryobacteraceae bacterium]|nr:hypothetical protein [Bryobacteraceae bacterium]
RRGSLSAASIRNVMADLDEEGYLSQPHTSAGRIPTGKAIQSYVQSLRLRRMASEELERLRAEFGRLDSYGARVEHTSHTLTQLTRGVGIAAILPAASPALDQIELVSLPERRILMVVMTRDGQVRNRVVSLQRAMSFEELQSIRNYINRNFSGWILETVRRELAARLEHASAAYDEILRRLTELYSKGLFDIGETAEIHMEGASNLMGLDLHLTREKTRELFRALEEKKRIVELLDRFLERRPGEIGVQVGLAEMHPTMGELSLIGLPVALPSGVSAVIAVLGPMRMNYARVMSAVRSVGWAFQES